MGKDTTHAFFVVRLACHLDVSLVAPCCSPAVLHEKVFLVIQGSETDRQNTMINFDSTFAVKHTRFVELDLSSILERRQQQVKTSGARGNVPDQLE